MDTSPMDAHNRRAERGRREHALMSALVARGLRLQGPVFDVYGSEPATSYGVSRPDESGMTFRHTGIISAYLYGEGTAEGCARRLAELMGVTPPTAPPAGPTS